MCLKDKTVEKEAIKKIEAREKALKDIFNTAPIGMALVEKTAYTFWSINISLGKLVGYSEEELIGKSVQVLCKTEEDFIELQKSISTSTFKDIRIVNKQKDVIYVCFKAADIGENILLVFKESINEDTCSGG